MARGICNQCGEDVIWHGGRGCSIKDVRCKCGGTVKGKTHGMPGKNLGRTMETCAVCGRRAYIFLHPTEDYRVEWPKAGVGPEGRLQVFKAGSPCCDTHVPRPLDAEDNFRLKHMSPEWCRIQNRKERFIFDAGKHREGATFREFVPEDPDYIYFGDYCRDECGIQCQYGSFYLTGAAGYPNLGEGLRYTGNAGDYHSIRIHKDDAQTFKERLVSHQQQKQE